MDIKSDGGEYVFVEYNEKQKLFHFLHHTDYASHNDWVKIGRIREDGFIDFIDYMEDKYKGSVYPDLKQARQDFKDFMFNYLDSNTMTNREEEVAKIYARLLYDWDMVSIEEQKRVIVENLKPIPPAPKYLVYFEASSGKFLQCDIFFKHEAVSELIDDGILVFKKIERCRNYVILVYDLNKDYQ